MSSDHRNSPTSSSTPGSIASPSTHRQSGEVPGESHPASSHQLVHRRSSSSSLRHHTQGATAPREVKETLNAHSAYGKSLDDGTTEHRINQYTIKQEIGRGSFGAVHLAVDEDGREYAIKQFSKSRLRRRVQSDLLRRSRKRAQGNAAIDSSVAGHSLSGTFDCLLDNDDPLYLIRQEIAIMKKLHHRNLVELYEVMDDPAEDSLYIVMERCRKGVAMKVGFGQHADPYDEERCRLWFRDLILGIGYLHAHGIAHRDIKPDNCLLTDDDVLKIVDFGVSEMFEKHSEMLSAKSVGSPAFFPPELCVANHGDVSGRAADIWSMGVTLYCLRYGRIPFEKEGILELYESIRSEEVELDDQASDDFRHLMSRILEKDPEKRIKMAELGEHPWVTNDGHDPLLYVDEETTEPIPMPTDQEVDDAITKDIRHVFLMVKVVSQLERMVEQHHQHRQDSLPQPVNILGDDDSHRFTAAPEPLDGREDVEVTLAERPKPKTRDSDPEEESNSNRPSSHHKIIDEPAGAPDSPHRPESSGSTGTRGHARNPLDDDPIFLDLAPAPTPAETATQARQPTDYFSSRPARPSSTDDDDNNNNNNPSISAEEEEEEEEEEESTPDHGPYTISESPGAADFEIYETAYRAEIERIRRQSRLSARTPAPTVYLTRRVDGEPDADQLLRAAHREGTLVSAASNYESPPHPPAHPPEALRELRGGCLNANANAKADDHDDGGGDARVNNRTGKSLWRAMSGSGKLSNIINRVRGDSKAEEEGEKENQNH